MNAEFYNREEEINELQIILANIPNAVYFVYGPINSGKTSLLMKVLNELSEEMICFYINFRGKDIDTSGAFLNLLFNIDRKSSLESVKEYFNEFAKGGSEILKKYTGIPVPVKIFDLIFGSKDKGEDAFSYLEDFFMFLCEKKKKIPILVLDELQMIKEIANASGRPLLEKIFNFMVRMTKETHTCHCLAATSDSLFIEEIYGDAKLKGRSRFFMVNDLDKKKAVAIYKQLGFKDSEIVWNCLGGKLGDIILLSDTLKIKSNEKKALDEILNDELMQLQMLFNYMDVIKPKVSIRDVEIVLELTDIKKILTTILKQNRIFQDDIRIDLLRCLVNENILFLNPKNGIVKFQSRLIENAMKKIVDKWENVK